MSKTTNEFISDSANCSSFNFENDVMIIKNVLNENCFDILTIDSDFGYKDTLENRIKELSSRISALQKDRDNLQSNLDQMKQYANEKVEKANGEIASYKSNATKLYNAVSNLKAQKANLQSRVDALTQEIENLNSQKEQNETQFSNLGQQYQILQSKNTQNSEEISRLVSAAEQLRSTNNQLQIRIQNLESQKAETESNLRTIEQNLSNLISRINRIDAQDEKRAAYALEGLLHLVDEGFLSEDKLAVTSAFWQDALTTRDQIQSKLDVLNDRNMGLDYWGNQFVEKMVSLLSSGSSNTSDLNRFLEKLSIIYRDVTPVQWRGFFKKAVHQAISKFAGDNVYRHVESRFGGKWAKLCEVQGLSFPWLDDAEVRIVNKFFEMDLNNGIKALLQDTRSLSQRVIQGAKPIIDDVILKAQEAERNTDCEEIFRKLKSGEDVAQFITKYDGLENVYKLLMNFLANKVGNEIFSNQSILNWEHAKDVEVSIASFKKSVEAGLRPSFINDKNITEIDKLKIVSAEGHMNLLSFLSKFWHVSGYGNEGEELTRILDNKFGCAQKLFFAISGKTWEYFLKTFYSEREIGQVVKFMQNRLIGEFSEIPVGYNFNGKKPLTLLYAMQILNYENFSDIGEEFSTEGSDTDNLKNFFESHEGVLFSYIKPQIMASYIRLTQRDIDDISPAYVQRFGEDEEFLGDAIWMAGLMENSYPKKSTFGFMSNFGQLNLAAEVISVGRKVNELISQKKKEVFENACCSRNILPDVARDVLEVYNDDLVTTYDQLYGLYRKYRTPLPDGCENWSEENYDAYWLEHRQEIEGFWFNAAAVAKQAQAEAFAIINDDQWNMRAIAYYWQKAKEELNFPISAEDAYGFFTIYQNTLIRSYSIRQDFLDQLGGLYGQAKFMATDLGVMRSSSAGFAVDCILSQSDKIKKELSASGATEKQVGEFMSLCMSLAEQYNRAAATVAYTQL